MAHDNVFIFGAGASCDAGIPLLNSFVETMWGYKSRGRSPRGDLSNEDRKLLEDADKIRTELERYNSRAYFDIRNLEDVLSLLSFEALTGDVEKGRYEVWIKAISRAIELSCKHTYREVTKVIPDKNTPYHAFWQCLLGADMIKVPPAIITFNYDLVLERTLFDCFHYQFPEPRDPIPAVPSCKLRYFVPMYDFTVHTMEGEYERPTQAGRPSPTRIKGFRGWLKYDMAGAVEIPYLKLHGSLNWGEKAIADTRRRPEQNIMRPNDPTMAADSPLILPPVFNKMNTGNVDSVWQKALEVLREAKHIIIVGYSLPRTDIYMQYFLKAAVGPNSNLQRIIVFDPILHTEGKEKSADDMKARYRECFSPQFQGNITFDPITAGRVTDSERAKARGTFFHFVQTLKYEQKSLLFTL